MSVKILSHPFIGHNFSMEVYREGGGYGYFVWNNQPANIFAAIYIMRRYFIHMMNVKLGNYVRTGMHV